MRKLYILGLIALAALIIGLAWADQITLTTYYPAPYGVYNDMVVMNSLGIGTTNPGSFLDSSGSQVTSLLLDIQPGTSQPGGIIVGSTGRAGAGTTNRQGYFLRRNDNWCSYPSGLWKGSDTSGTASEYWENLVINNDGGGANIIFMTNRVEKMRIQVGGNVGIGTTSPGAQLDLSTDSARKLSTTTWATGSDIRLKKDIRPFTDGLDVISRINPVWFKWNGKAGRPDDGKDNIGVIGQEIEKVAPYTVTRTKAKLEPTDKDETELIDFTSHALTFALINAVKEQQQRIEQLEARLVALERRK